MTSYKENYTELETKIITWAREREILKLATTQAQVKKTLEEATELLIGVCNDDLEEISDGIGDTLVTLIILAELCQLNVLDCLSYAYNEIKSRKGKMVDGIFIKES